MTKPTTKPKNAKKTNSASRRDGVLADVPLFKKIFGPFREDKACQQKAPPQVTMRREDFETLQKKANGSARVSYASAVAALVALRASLMPFATANGKPLRRIDLDPFLKILETDETQQ